MLVKVVKEDSKNLEIDVIGADQSLLYIIQQELLNDKRVVFAAYNKPHPLLKSQKMQLIVKEGNPKKIFNESCVIAGEKASDTIGLLNKVLERA